MCVGDIRRFFECHMGDRTTHFTYKTGHVFYFDGNELFTSMKLTKNTKLLDIPPGRKMELHSVLCSFVELEHNQDFRVMLIPFLVCDVSNDAYNLKLSETGIYVNRDIGEKEELILNIPVVSSAMRIGNFLTLFHDNYAYVQKKKASSKDEISDFSEFSEFSALENSEDDDDDDDSSFVVSDSHVSYYSENSENSGSEPSVQIVRFHEI